MDKKNRKKWYHFFCYFAPEDCDHCSPFCDCNPEWIEEDEKKFKFYPSHEADKSLNGSKKT